MVVGAGKNFDMAALWKTSTEAERNVRDNRRETKGRGYAVILEFLRLFTPKLYTYEERVSALAGGSDGASSTATVNAAIDAVAVTPSVSAVERAREADAALRTRLGQAARFANGGAQK